MPQPYTPALGSSQFTQRMTVEKDTGQTQADSFGNIVPVYATYLTRWARLKYLGGNEFVVDNQVEAERNHEITMLLDTLTQMITPEMRITFDGRTLNIIAVESLSMRRLVIIRTKESVPGST